MPDSTVTVVGNLTRDPEIRYTTGGAAKASFGMAVSRRWQNRQSQEWEEQTSFFNVVCWREMAENVSESLGKGSRVVVTGRLEQRSWETENGEKRSVVEIVADEVGPSLRWATAQVTRNERRGGGDFGGGGGGGGEIRRRRRWRRREQAGRVVDRHVRRLRRGALLMARERRSNSKSAAADRRRPQKKKISILNTEQVEWIDYKDVNLLRRFMSERAKIRARRVTGNSTQQQREVAKAIRLAREMALLPYSVRQVTQRKGGRRDRGDRGELREEMPPRPSEPVESEYVAAVEIDEVSTNGVDVVEIDVVESVAPDGDAGAGE